MKKRIRIAAVAVLLLLVAGCVAYLWPVEKQLRVTMCTAQGETAEVVIDVRFKKSLIYPTVMEGTITFDGRDYQEFGAERGSFLKGIRDKVEYGGNPPQPCAFVVQSNDFAERMSSMIFVVSPDKRIRNVFDAFSLVVSRNGEPSVEYYGPAESAEEAERIKSLYATPAK